MECLFCKIVKKEIPAAFLAETEKLLAFNDIRPKAPVHVLVVPKTHFDSVKTLPERERVLAGELVLLAKKIAAEKNLEGYKLIFNVGRAGGQLIDHLHLHLVGGWSEAPGKVEI